MKIRSSKFIFIASTVVLLLMLAGPITMFCIIDKSSISFLMLIPVIIIGIMFVFNLLNYLLNYFGINEKSITKRFFAKKSLDISKDNVSSIAVNYIPGSNQVMSFQINYIGKDNKEYFTQISGNMFNLNKIIEAFKKYGYPIIEQ